MKPLHRRVDGVLIDKIPCTRFFFFCFFYKFLLVSIWFSLYRVRVIDESIFAVAGIRKKGFCLEMSSSFRKRFVRRSVDDYREQTDDDRPRAIYLCLQVSTIFSPGVNARATTIRTVADSNIGILRTRRRRRPGDTLRDRLARWTARYPISGRFRRFSH